MRMPRYVSIRSVIILLFLTYGFTFSMYYLDYRQGTNSLAYIILTNAIMIIIFFATLLVRAGKLKKDKDIVFTNDRLNVSVLDSMSIDTDMKEIILDINNSFESYRCTIESEISEERDFMSKWIHDIKVPLSAIKLVVENIDFKDMESYLTVDRELSNLESSIKKMFYILKTNRFSDDYRITEVSLSSLVNSSLKGFATFFSYKSLELDIDIEETNILTDKKWCEYVLSEIISNAVKYTPRCGKIRISSYSNDDNIIISVRNTGSGIDKVDINRVFSKGFTSMDRQGLKSTGYGLYLADKISKLLGHELRVRSDHESWSEFQLVMSKQDEVFNLTKM